MLYLIAKIFLTVTYLSGLSNPPNGYVECGSNTLSGVSVMECFIWENHRWHLLGHTTTVLDNATAWVLETYGINDNHPFGYAHGPLWPTEEACENAFKNKHWGTALNEDNPPRFMHECQPIHINLGR
jgi:hypothetical protein